VGKVSKYVIVSPVKNEAKYIEETIKSVVQQTVKPLRWVIVDDDSSDRSVELIRPFREQYPWIELVQVKRGPTRQTGSAEASAFNRGYEFVRTLDFDYIVKLDGDLRFEKDYFEELLNRCEADAGLGIASGMYFEKGKNGWKAVKMPHYHAAGASKVLKKPCFEMIGGFLATPGWDSVDEIRAQYLGWRTRHFKDLHFFHLKNEGSGMGLLQTNHMHGKIFYLSGGSKPFFFLKVFHRILFGKPFFLGGIWMMAGFLKPFLTRKQLLVTAGEARFYRRLLNARIMGVLHSLTGRRCA